jgi:hypothetical protein
VYIRTNLWNHKGKFMILQTHEHIAASYIYKAVNGLRISVYDTCLVYCFEILALRLISFVFLLPCSYELKTTVALRSYPASL